MKRNLCRRCLISTLVMLAIGSVACGGSNNPAAPSAPRYDGTWNGTGSSSSLGIRSMQFVVQNNVITSFNLTYAFSTSSVCSFNAAVNAAITNAGASLAFQNGGLSATFTATFSSTSQGSVSTDRVTFTNVVCNGTINGFAAGSPISVAK